MVLPILCGIAILILSISCVAGTASGNGLRVVIIRHAEKPESGDNLSCQGENRAVQLAGVLYQKFQKPDHIYVPSLGRGKSGAHARMFQTVTPFAIKYDLSVNSEFDENDYSAIAGRVLRKTGTVLMVWQHQAIPKLAESLGVANPPKWKGKDFDSIWVITVNDGKAQLSIDKEGINPSPNCNF